LTGVRSLHFKEVSVLREQETNHLPDGALEALARRLYPAIRSYFESEEGQREFAEWQARRGAKHEPEEAKPGEQAGLAA
jgi:hypothetical protein